MRYKVSKRGSHGKRIVTDKTFTKRSKAEEYCRLTNRYFKGDNARVIKVKKKRR